MPQLRGSRSGGPRARRAALLSALLLPALMMGPGTVIAREDSPGEGVVSVHFEEGEARLVTDALARYLTPEVRAAMESRTPLARLGTVEDIAAAALYLAAPASSWMTGKVLELDGGAEATVWPL